MGGGNMIVNIDIAAIKPGDEIDVRLTVEAVRAEWAIRTNWPVRVFLNGEHDHGIDANGNVRTEVIVGHYPAPLKAGDTVQRRIDFGGVGHVTILAIDGEVAWLRLGAENHLTCKVADLVRVFP